MNNAYSGQTKKVSFDPKVDYAAEIRNTSDPAKRQDLLEKRQAKIDAMGLSDKVGPNYIVAGWRPTERESDWKAPFSREGLYDAAASARLKAFGAMQQQIERRLNANLQDIDSSFEAGRRQTAINARRSALANEEKLAALGLSGGAAYDAPTSGYTETSRVAADNAYRSDLNALDRARMDARQKAYQQAADATASLAAGHYREEASASMEQAKEALHAFESDRSYTLSLAGMMGYLNGTPTMKMQLEQQAAARTAEQTAYDRAMQRWKLYGYVLPADSAILGVAPGVSTADMRYKNAQLAISRARLK